MIRFTAFIRLALSTTTVYYLAALAAIVGTVIAVIPLIGDMT